MDVPLEDILVRNEYLLANNHVETTLELFDIENLLYIFTQSTQYMKQFQADVLTNEPYELEAFAQTEFVEKCDKCNYKEICLK